MIRTGQEYVEYIDSIRAACARLAGGFRLPAGAKRPVRHPPGLLRRRRSPLRGRARLAADLRVRGLAARGLGYGLLATKPASNVSYDGHALATLPLDGEVDGSRVVLAARGGVRPSGAAGALAAHCRDFFRGAR